MTTVLVVDDSAMDRRLAGGLVQKNTDFSVLFAVDGDDALDQIESHLPDLVITDLQMPRKNGLELVSAIKRDFRLIPVILMTARGSEEIAVQALRAGAASYCAKDRLAKDLVDTIEQVLAASRADRSKTRLLAHRMVKNELSFVIENDLSLIAALVNYVQNAVDQAKLCDETERLRVGIALDEALLNAYYHGNLEVRSEIREADHDAYYELAVQRQTEAPYRDRRIHLDVRITHDDVTFVVRDEGQGFDPAALPDPVDPKNLDRPCGRGILLMKTFMDEVRYSDKANEVTLVKRRSLRQDDTEED